MPNKRRINLGSYGISEYGYDELDAFCKQYPQKIEQLREIRNTLGAQNLSGMPKSADASSQTENAAIRAAMLSRDTEIIEQAAIKASSAFYSMIITYVTAEVPKKPFNTKSENIVFESLLRNFYKTLYEMRNNI